MTLEALLLPAMSALMGWIARHYGLFAPANATPQPRQGDGTAVVPPPAQADLPSMVASVVSLEIRKALAALETRLNAPNSPAVSPQP